MNLKKPKFWDYKSPNILSYLLFPISFLISLLNFLKIKSKFKNPRIKTICVGNIYVGGTGKTSLCIKINEILIKKKIKSCFVKKFYVNQSDEQKLLKNRGPLFSNKKRVDALNEAASEGYEVAILDDGLQDRSISYDLSFVCFNNLNWIGNGLTIPAGPLREKLSSLIKYDAVFLNNENENIDSQKNIIRKYNPKILIFETNYQAINMKNINIINRFTIFSGIGNPDSFKKTLLANKVQIFKEFIFPDHYNYNDDDINMVKLYAKKFNTKILTTEKDFIKLKPSLSNGIDVIKVEPNIIQQENLIKLIQSKLNL